MILMYFLLMATCLFLLTFPYPEEVEDNKLVSIECVVLSETLYYDAARDEVFVYKRTPENNYFEYQYDTTSITAMWDIVLDPKRFKYIGDV